MTKAEVEKLLGGPPKLYVRETVMRHVLKEAKEVVIGVETAVGIWPLQPPADSFIEAPEIRVHFDNTGAYKKTFPSNYTTSILAKLRRLLNL